MIKCFPSLIAVLILWHSSHFHTSNAMDLMEAVNVNHSSPASDTKVNDHSKPSLGEDDLLDINYARVLFDRALELKKQGDLEYAKELSEKAAEIASRIHGPRSPQHARCLDLLGRILFTKGNYEEAEIVLESAQEILARYVSNSPSDKDWRWFLTGVDSNLALVKRERGKYQEAEALYKQALLEYDSIEVPLPLECAILQLYLGQLYLETDDLQKAKPYVTNGYETIKKLANKSDSLYVLALVAVGRLNMRNQEYREAEEAYLSAMEMEISARGKDTLGYASICDYLAELRIAQKRLDLGNKLINQALEIRKEELGVNHPDVLSTHKKLRLTEPLDEDSP